MAYRSLVFGTISLLLIFTFSCKNDPSSSGKQPELEIDTVISEHAGLGWQINEIVTTGSEIFEMTAGLENENIDNYSNVPGARIIKERALMLQRKYYTLLPDQPMLLKPLILDTLIFIENINKGEKLVAVYDTETGFMRFYFVKYKFPIGKLIYDSTEVKFDVNFTIDDDRDDRLLNFYRLRHYDETHILQKIVETVVFTDYIENEPTGLEITGTNYYHENMKLEMLVRFIDINPDGSASVREDFTWDDGKTSYNSITFYANNTGEYEKKFRDGTVVSGTFDVLEDDLQGSFTQLIDLPAGRFVDKIMKSAQVWITLPDTVLNAIYDEIVYFKSGDIDSAHIDIEFQEEAGVIIAAFTVKKKNNAHGSFEYMGYEDGSGTLTGDWTTWNEYYILLEAEYYVEGSAHIHYEVFAPPYTPGDDPVLVVDYDILPDGSGEGTITYQGEIYTITFEKFGEAIITKDGAETQINLY
jgi:antitoxin component YwqK of YwqJK toxin-antitoxin module